MSSQYLTLGVIGAVRDWRWAEVFAISEVVMSFPIIGLHFALAPGFEALQKVVYRAGHG